MPMYEYQCEKCGEKFSVIVSWFKRNKVNCPQCGSKNVKRLVSRFSVNSLGCGDNKKLPFG
ncbi:MAG TPA: zinc ribbon domain-containing protein [Syntrophomonadaceae bacterium]|nr:zinc ribbon domain-containing protein [Syntrophomonadaceae bacterium]